MNKPRYMLVSLERIPSETLKRFRHPERSKNKFCLSKEKQDSQPSTEKTVDFCFKSEVKKTSESKTHGPSTELHVDLQNSSEKDTNEKGNLIIQDKKESSIHHSTECQLTDCAAGIRTSECAERSHFGQEEMQMLQTFSEGDAGGQGNVHINQVSSNSNQHYGEFENGDSYDCESTEQDPPMNGPHRSNDKYDELIPGANFSALHDLSKETDCALRPIEAIEKMSEKYTKDHRSMHVSGTFSRNGEDWEPVCPHEKGISESYYEIHSPAGGHSCILNSRDLPVSNTYQNMSHDPNVLTPYNGQIQHNGYNNVSYMSNNVRFQDELHSDVASLQNKGHKSVNSFQETEPGYFAENIIRDISGQPDYLNKDETVQENHVSEQSFSTARSIPSRFLYSNTSPTLTLSSSSLGLNANSRPPNESTDFVQRSSMDLSMNGCNRNGIVDAGTVPTIKICEAERIVRNIEWTVYSSTFCKGTKLRRGRKSRKRHRNRKMRKQQHREQYYIKQNPATGNPIVAKRKSGDSGYQGNTPKKLRPEFGEATNIESMDSLENTNISNTPITSKCRKDHIEGHEFENIICTQEETMTEIRQAVLVDTMTDPTYDGPLIYVAAHGQTDSLKILTDSEQTDTLKAMSKSSQAGLLETAAEQRQLFPLEAPREATLSGTLKDGRETDVSETLKGNLTKQNKIKTAAELGSGDLLLTLTELSQEEPTTNFTLEEGASKLSPNETITDSEQIDSQDTITESEQTDPQDTKIKARLASKLETPTVTQTSTLETTSQTRQTNPDQAQSIESVTQTEHAEPSETKAEVGQIGALDIMTQYTLACPIENLTIPDNADLVETVKMSGTVNSTEAAIMTRPLHQSETEQKHATPSESMAKAKQIAAVEILATSDKVPFLDTATENKCNQSDTSETEQKQINQSETTSENKSMTQSEQKDSVENVYRFEEIDSLATEVETRESDLLEVNATDLLEMKESEKTVLLHTDNKPWREAKLETSCVIKSGPMVILETTIDTRKDEFNAMTLRKITYAEFGHTNLSETLTAESKEVPNQTSTEPNLPYSLMEMTQTGEEHGKKYEETGKFAQSMHVDDNADNKVPLESKAPAQPGTSSSSELNTQIDHKETSAANLNPNIIPDHPCLTTNNSKLSDNQSSSDIATGNLISKQKSVFEEQLERVPDHTFDNSKDSKTVCDYPFSPVVKQRQQIKHFQRISLGLGLRSPAFRLQNRRRQNQQTNNILKSKVGTKQFSTFTNVTEKMSHGKARTILEKAWFNILKHDYQEGAKKTHFAKPHASRLSFKTPLITAKTSSNSYSPLTCTCAPMIVTASSPKARESASCGDTRYVKDWGELGKRLMQPTKISQTLLKTYYSVKQSSRGAISLAATECSKDIFDKSAASKALVSKAFRTEPQLTFSTASAAPLSAVLSSSEPVHIQHSSDYTSVQAEKRTCTDTEDTPPPLLEITKGSNSTCTSSSQQPLMQAKQVNHNATVHQSYCEKTGEQLLPLELTTKKMKSGDKHTADSKHSTLLIRYPADKEKVHVDIPKVSDNQIGDDELRQSSRLYYSKDRIQNKDFLEKKQSEVMRDTDPWQMSTGTELPGNIPAVHLNDSSIATLEQNQNNVNNPKTKLFYHELDRMIARREMELQSLYSKRACGPQKMCQTVSQGNMNCNIMNYVQTKDRISSERPNISDNNYPEIFKAPPAHGKEKMFPLQPVNLQKSPHLPGSMGQSIAMVAKCNGREQAAPTHVASKQTHSKTDQKFIVPYQCETDGSGTRSVVFQQMINNNNSTNLGGLASQVGACRGSNMPASIVKAPLQQMHAVNNKTVHQQNEQTVPYYPRSNVQSVGSQVSKTMTSLGNRLEQCLYTNSQIAHQTQSLPGAEQITNIRMEHSSMCDRNPSVGQIRPQLHTKAHKRSMIHTLHPQVLAQLSSGAKIQGLLGDVSLRNSTPLQPYQIHSQAEAANPSERIISEPQLSIPAHNNALYVNAQNEHNVPQSTSSTTQQRQMPQINHTQIFGNSHLHDQYTKRAPLAPSSDEIRELPTITAQEAIPHPRGPVGQHLQHSSPMQIPFGPISQGFAGNVSHRMLSPPSYPSETGKQNGGNEPEQSVRIEAYATDVMVSQGQNVSLLGDPNPGISIQLPLQRLSYVYAQSKPPTKLSYSVYGQTETPFMQGPLQASGVPSLGTSNLASFPDHIQNHKIGQNGYQGRGPVAVQTRPHMITRTHLVPMHARGALFQNQIPQNPLLVPNGQRPQRIVASIPFPASAPQTGLPDQTYQQTRNIADHSSARAVPDTVRSSSGLESTEATFILGNETRQQFKPSESELVDITACHVCTKPASFLCGSCQVAWYCSRECQVAAWENHQKYCQRRA